MRAKRRVLAALPFAAGAALGAYLATAGVAWCRYGRVALPADPSERDEWLDHFVPSPDVAERHHIRVNAPAEVTFQAAKAMDLASPWLAHAIFTAREWIMGSERVDRGPSRGFVADMQQLGWGVLAEDSHEIVMGGVTKPWEANPTFRALPPGEFAAFAEPGLVKIAFTLRADPLDGGRSIFRTETRAVATDEDARHRFRTYWAFLSPGIVVIRWALLRPVKSAAERLFAGRGAG